MKRGWITEPSFTVVMRTGSGSVGQWFGVRSDNQPFFLNGTELERQQFDLFLDRRCVCSIPPSHSKCPIHGVA